MTTPEGDKRSTDIRVRVTPEESEELQVAAEIEGTALSAWLRSLGLRSAHRIDK
ncbi:MAG: hypothetical protein ACERJ2_17215 [Filomicrobium sp.]